MNNIGSHFKARHYTIRSLTIVGLALAAVAVPTLISPNTALADRDRAGSDTATRDQHYGRDQHYRDDRGDRNRRADRDNRRRDHDRRDRKRNRNHQTNHHYGSSHHTNYRPGNWSSHRSGGLYANNWRYANYWHDRNGRHARKHRSSGVILGLGLGLLTHQLTHIDRPRGRDRVIVVDRPVYPSGQWSSQAPVQQASYSQLPEGCLQTREYQTVVIIAGEERDAYGQACLMPDGSWLQGPPMIEPNFQN